MANSETTMLAEIARYYADRLAAHGPTAHGVDWNGAESQTSRFRELARVISENDPFSVNDLGCGYGAFFDYLAEHRADFVYNGFDIAAEMIATADKRLSGVGKARFVIADRPDTIADYGVASGIFNVRLDRTDADWKRYCFDVIEMMNATSARGFSFNCLTSFSDLHKRRDYLYYANPGEFFDYCKLNFSRNVALLHDYDLYEFTILVRKYP